MTENETAHREQPSAGEVGVHRRPMGQPLINPGFSRNIAPQRIEGPEVIEISEDGRGTDESWTAAVRRAAVGISTKVPRRSGPVSERTRATSSTRPRTALKERHGEADRSRTAPRRRKRPMMLLAASATFLLILRRLIKRSSARGRRPAPVMRRIPLPENRRSRPRRRT